MQLPQAILDADEVWRGPKGPLQAVPICRVRCYTNRSQCQTLWCWAAILQELLRCRDQSTVPPTQCQIVARNRKQDSCTCAEGDDCQPDKPHPCNKRGFLESLLDDPFDAREKFTYYRYKPSKLTPGTLCQWLRDGHNAAIFFDGGSNHHYAVVSAVQAFADGSGKLHIADPYRSQSYALNWTPGYSIVHATRGGIKLFLLIE